MNTSTYDGILLYYLWKRIGSLIGLTCKDELDESDPSNDQEFNKKWINNNNNQQMNNNLIEHYLNNSIQIILNANLPTNSKLNNEYKFTINCAKTLITILKYEFPRNLKNKVELKSEILKLIKKSCKILLHSSCSSSENDENSFSQHVNYMNRLLSLTCCDSSLIDLINWLDISNKFYEQHLRPLKTRTNTINLNETNYESVNSCILYPFKHYKCIEIQDSDIKLIVNSCTSVAKSFSGLIKQNRIKMDNNNDISNVNNWSMILISKMRFLNQEIQHSTNSNDNNDSLILESHFANSSTHLNDESTIKILQIQIQVSLYILQNMIEFDTINQQQNTNEPINHLLHSLKA